MADFPQQPFPDLPPRAELFEKIRLLDKGWLDGASMGHPVELFSALQAAMFIEVKGTLIDKQLNDFPRTANLGTNHLSAMYGIDAPILFVIESRGWEKRILFGTDSGKIAALQGLVTGMLGQHLVSPSPVRFTPTLSRGACAVITGVPDVSRRQGQPKTQQEVHIPSIDDLLTTMDNANWLYVVLCKPLARQQARGWFEQCSREIQVVTESALNRDIQKANRLATHYVKMLEKTINRLKAGFTEGLWANGVYFLSSESTEVGLSLLLPVFSGERSEPEPIRGHLCVSGGTAPSFTNLLTSREALSFMRLPEREYQGYRLREQIFFDQDLADHTGAAVSVGSIVSANTVSNRQARIPVDHLTRHGLIAGTTGSGKTNTLFNILLSLWREHHVPFLVIEPTKSEYRNLIRLVDNLLVFTLGDETPGASSPFRLNPFQFPQGVPLQTHISHLTAAFNASFVMYAPMPQVLEECLYEIYRDKGWNLVSSRSPRGFSRGSFPTLTDLYDKIDDVVNRLGYEERIAMDIRSALKIRINNLRLGGKGLMLDTVESVPLAEILRQPTVLELRAMGNDDEKTFVMGLLLTAIYEHYEAEPGQGSDGLLRHLTLIEEAHRLLKNVPTEKTSEDQANMKGRAVEAFCNMLSEVRAYGEGILVAEQIPTKLAPDILKNTGMKILHRLVAKEEREAMGHAMNLDEPQMRHAATLSQGEAIFFREGFDRPYLIAAPVAPVSTAGGIIATTDLNRRMLTGFYQKHLPLLHRYPYCQACGQSLSARCAAAQTAVAEILIGERSEISAVRRIFPLLISGGRGSGNLSPFHGEDGEIRFFCLEARLMTSYFLERAGFFGASFRETRELLDRIAAVPEIEGRLALARSSFSSLFSSSTPPFSLCRRYCRNICRYGYEGSILCRDAGLHNTLLDLIEAVPGVGQDETGAGRQRLVEAVRNWFHGKCACAEEISLCFAISKLNELLVRESLQESFLQTFFV
ncbi:MAG: ATP-binding protein [Deltaproteobacteria bacterium]|nr:ATP-binding protein [Deltaproteobacteria bacterium]